MHLIKMVWSFVWRWDYEGAFRYVCNQVNISLFTKSSQNRYMNRIESCVNFHLIPHMFKSVQSTYVNSLIKTVYLSRLKLKWLGEGLFTDQIRSYIKNRCYLGKEAKDILNELCLVYRNSLLSYSSVDGARNLKAVWFHRMVYVVQKLHHCQKNE